MRMYDGKITVTGVGKLKQGNFVTLTMRVESVERFASDPETYRAGLSPLYQVTQGLLSTIGQRILSFWKE
jgi:hypothetical protein